eukprot:NODE_3592_length_426_cov_49.193634_g3158_i0.p2 GENE.NODE_3592_length_426_cov_49.193634_g3158_i0~~NODE_3592_length_426_cov_49.193634_g3158_i0.p2  ORF type:complete len:94 (+),score=33.92 NODE_3592_length_426_cov_49.193634_g3158_i0:22-282(+)
MGVMIDGVWCPLLTTPSGAVFFITHGKQKELTPQMFIQKFESGELLPKVAVGSGDTFDTVQLPQPVPTGAGAASPPSSPPASPRLG